MTKKPIEEEDPIKQKVNEIFSFMRKRGSVPEEYEKVIYTLIKKLNESGCRLRPDDREIDEDGEKTKTKYCHYSSTIVLVDKVDKRLPAKFQNDGISTIYSLLHEYGHHLDTDKMRHNCEQRFSREKRAWCYAHEEFNKLKAVYTFLEGNYHDFIEYRNFCLEKYREDYEKCNQRENR